jgi:hypothetical protein
MTTAIPAVRSRFVYPRLVNDGKSIRVDAEFKADPQWAGKRLFAMNLRFLYDSAQFKWGVNNVRIVDLVPTWRLGTDSFALSIRPQKTSNTSLFYTTGGVVYVNTNVQGALYEEQAKYAGVPTLDNWVKYFAIELDLVKPMVPGDHLYPLLIWDKTRYIEPNGNRGMIAGDGLTLSLVINPNGQYVNEIETVHLNWNYFGPGNIAPFGAPTALTSVSL